MRRADVFRVGPSVAHFGYDLRDSWWGIPRFRTIELSEITKQFHELCEVSLSREHILDSPLIKVKAVSRKLKTLYAETPLQIRQKAKCGFFCPLADLETGHFRVECDKNPLISDFRRVRFANLPRLLSNEAPNLIALQVVRAQVADRYSIGGGGIAYTSDLRRLSVLTTLGRSYLTPQSHFFFALKTTPLSSVVSRSTFSASTSLCAAVITAPRG